MKARIGPLVAYVISCVCFTGSNAEYLGKFIGKLSELHHGVSGEVYAVDGRTLHIKDFTYDGQGPAAYFYAGNTRVAGSSGFRLRDENGKGDVIRRYRKEGVTLTLPEGKTLNNIKIFYVWCEEFAVNFGDVKIPRNFDYPKPQKIDALNGVHGISSDNIVIVDAQTLLIPNLSYDGEAPDAKFWVGRGPKPSPQGIRVPDENGKEVPLRRYDRKTVVLTLPGDLTVFDIGHFGIWCEAFTVDFGHIQIPQDLNVPPSLKMLGVSPQSKLNCEVLHDNLAFEVRWAVAGDSVVVQLVAKLDDGEYMSFGISGEEDRSAMIKGDVVVAWVDKETLKGYAEDYYLESKSQCSGPSGSCPDARFKENTNSVRLLNAAMVNGYSIVTYQRPLKASDEFDQPIRTNRTQAIIWAIGPLNQRKEVSFHSHYPKSDHFLHFGRPAKWNCPMPETDQPSMKSVLTSREVEEPPTLKSRGSERRRTNQRVPSRQELVDNTAKASQPTHRRGGGRPSPSKAVPTPAPVTRRDAWVIPPIQCDEPDDGVFYAQMGPTGGKRGYPAITGHVGWGISWYINGLLIPEIHVVRGKTYTFVVEGGFDPEIPAKYHPFYITDDPVGGYEHKTAEEKKAVKIFAGARVNQNGKVIPTGVGRLCHWTQQGDVDADDFESFGAYQRVLQLKCDPGEPGVIQWIPDQDTPDVVYYQCFTHRYLGWKIHVHDSCDQDADGSEQISVIVPAPKDTLDLEASPSVRVETMVKPNDIIGEEKKIKVITAISEKDPSIDAHQFYAPAPVYLNKVPSIPKQSTHGPVEASTNRLEEPSTSNSTTTTPSTNTIFPSIPDRMMPPSFVMRRPITPNFNRFHYPMKKPLRPRPSFTIKKPLMLAPVSKYPMFIPYPSPHYKDKIKFRPDRRPSNYLIFKPEIITKSPPLSATTTQSVKIVKNVEISPQQASTEREIDIQTSKPPVKQPVVHLPPARNTGFHPESLVIEGGFKPIITKPLEDRIDNEPELAPESEIGIIQVEGEKYPDASFEPVFVPSPLDKDEIKRKLVKVHKRVPYPKKHIVKVVIKHPRSVDDILLEAEASRVDSYYLPPEDQTQKPVEIIRNPSNIDIEDVGPAGVAPDIVVTYDGKKVSGASLTARIDRPQPFDIKASRAQNFIRARPQFVPFRGELPPLDSEEHVIQTQTQGILSRDLDAPLLPDNGGSTKLLPVEIDRKKRAAHHTPEHTLEQQKQKQVENANSSSSSVSICIYFTVSVVAVHVLGSVMVH